MPSRELDQFLKTWDYEAQNTAKLLRALPKDKYDFRPDAGGRSLGELAWHLSDADAYISYGIEIGKFTQDTRPPNIERPRAVEALAPGYERVHAEAVARVRKLEPDDLNRKLTFFDGKEYRVGDLLWGALLHHLIHHRGQLSLMCRLAGGASPGIYGPNREETAAMRAKA